MLQLPHRDLIQSPLTAQELHAAAAFVAAALPATPQLRWPLLAARTGCDVVVKHENHLPTGAFKVRGGVWVMQQLQTHYPQMKGVVAATRGNHGQSVAFAAERAGLRIRCCFSRLFILCWCRVWRVMRWNCSVHVPSWMPCTRQSVSVQVYAA